MSTQEETRRGGAGAMHAVAAERTVTVALYRDIWENLLISLAIGEGLCRAGAGGLVRHHHRGFPPAAGTIRGATNAPPTSPMRPMAAPGLNLPLFVVSVDHEDPAGCRGGSSTSQRRRRAALTS